MIAYLNQPKLRSYLANLGQHYLQEINLSNVILDHHFSSSSRLLEKVI